MAFSPAPNLTVLCPVQELIRTFAGLRNDNAAVVAHVGGNTILLRNVVRYHVTKVSSGQT
jgi:uncharacterized membrane protein